ncbi:response regulator transcription factor [Pseudomonas sp. FEN]|uniref:response regulator transcription factor n=1 Tax=Pseudomonas sp. FEN TaxID=2767468 RepID=UPI001CD3D6F3|nr:response regulator transcription factor [Pseudomonas sp. FEN]
MSPSFSSPYTVMLLDDHEVVRQGIEIGLAKEADLEVIGSFGTGRELVTALTQRQADVVVIDFILGPSEIDGINLIRVLKRRFGQCKPLVLSSHYTPATVALSLKAGGRGFLGKVQNLGELATAIRTVAQGRIYLQPSMTAQIAEVPSGFALAHMGSTSELSSSLTQSSNLSPREQEVLRCFLDGMSVNAIAAKFSRSANTISTQKQSAYRKLGIKNDSELFKIFHQTRESVSQE